MALSPGMVYECLLQQAGCMLTPKDVCILVCQVCDVLDYMVRLSLGH